MGDGRCTRPQQRSLQTIAHGVGSYKKTTLECGSVQRAAHQSHIAQTLPPVRQQQGQRLLRCRHLNAGY